MDFQDYVGKSRKLNQFFKFVNNSLQNNQED